MGKNTPLLREGYACSLMPVHVGKGLRLPSIFAEEWCVNS